MGQRGPVGDQMGTVKPPKGTAQTPDWLKGEALKEWERVLPLLVKMGLGSPAETDLIAIYCVLVADIRRLTAQLEAEGYTVKTAEGGTKTNPLFGVRRVAIVQMKAYAESLGLSPASRARLRVPPPEQQPLMTRPRIFTDRPPTVKGE